MDDDDDPRTTTYVTESGTEFELSLRVGNKIGGMGGVVLMSRTKNRQIETFSRLQNPNSLEPPDALPSFPS